MKKRFLSLFLLLVLTLSLFACGSKGYVADDNSASGMDKGEMGYGSSEGGATMDTAVPIDRKIIKTVNESVETETYDAFIKALEAAVTEMDGYFVSSRYTGDGVESKRNRQASFEIRIPAEKLSDFTGKVGALATVLNYYENANDVTQAYVDVESRIAVLEAEETALLAILADARNTSAVIEVRKSLSETQANLASLRAQKKNYDTLVAYSTVHLNVSEVEVARAGDTGFFSEVGNTFRSSLSAIGRFFRTLGVFLLGASPILLLVAAVAVAVLLTVRVILRRNAKKENERTDTDKTE